MNGRFQPGTQLKVRRPLGYFHHGIYVSDDRVIQFGSGVTLANKHAVGINAVSLEEFEQSGTAEAVRHGYESPFSGWHPAADEPWKIIERAEFLLRLQPHLPYNLIGHNCEIIANMCSCGSWTESYQTRKFFLARTAMDIPLILFMGARSRANLPLPRWVYPVAIAGFIATMTVRHTYNDQIKQFWKEIRADWQAHERKLAQDLRNA